MEEVYFPYCSRKWKKSTRGNNVNRVSGHPVAKCRDRERGDELQDLLDEEARGGGSALDLTSSKENGKCDTLDFGSKCHYSPICVSIATRNAP